jgi:hypothetical protein
MPRQLNIRSDEAAETVSRLAQHLGKSQTEIVVEALRRYGAQVLPSTKVTREKALADLEALRRMVDASNSTKPPAATSDHSFLYDESGLPK